MQDDVEQRTEVLSTLPAAPSERRIALATVLVSIVVFAALAPFAQTPLAKVWAFIPVYESALVINDLITAVLLLAQFRIVRTRALLVIACGYLFTATITVAHALTFPGLFSDSGLLGANPQSTAWLYMFWHGGFPLLVIAYAMLKSRDEATVARGRVGAAVGLGVLTVFAAVSGLTLLATVGQELLPAIMRGNRYTPAMIFVVGSVWASSIVALIALWRRRPYSVLDAWLMVVMCAWVFDIALSAVLNAGRFDLGFYAGRIYGLLAASFVLIMLLFENTTLYARLAERTAQLQAANRELEAFTYSVSHDLRAPLRAIDGFSGILEADYRERLDEEGRRLLARVRRNAQRMEKLIEDLLAFSRLGRQPIRTVSVSLDDLVHEVLNELQPARPERAATISVGRLGAVEADPALLRHVLTNLLGNAIKFTGKTAVPAIEVGCRETTRDKTRTYYVKDNGAGFDMQYADKLFGVFQRLHRPDDFEGTGVGLAIVQQIIHRHGGRVWADAKPGEGATFYFTLRAGALEASHMAG
jgi:signal transduction histidine kinase